MAVLTVAEIVSAGIDPALVAAGAGGDSFPSTGQEFLYVTNGDSSSTTVTVDTPQTVAGLAVANLAVVVPATSSRLIGPFVSATFSSTISLTYSSVTSLTVGAFRLIPVQ